MTTPDQSIEGGAAAAPAASAPTPSPKDDRNPLAAAVRALIAGEPVPDVLGPVPQSPELLTIHGTRPRSAQVSLPAMQAAAPAQVPPPSEQSASQPLEAATAEVLVAGPASVSNVVAIKAAEPEPAATQSDSLAKGKARRMPAALYIVIQSLGRWWVDFEGKPYGPFDDPEDARNSAIEIARVFGDEHRVREVIVVREGRGYDVVWSSDRSAAA